MSTPEPLKTGIDYNAIGEAYGYKPIPEDFQETPPVDISIDWKTGADERRAQQRAAMERFDDIPLQPSRENQKRQEALLNSATVPTDKGNLRLVTEKWAYPEKGEAFLRLHLSDETGIEVGQYISGKRGNVWDMHDRITSETYRGKGIASQMIEATENCVQAYADAKGEDQEIIMDASQPPVLSVFLRKGYEVVDEDRQRFAEVMAKLAAGDPSYVLASCEADFRENREERKTWYVFERETYERFGDKIWNYDESDGKANYMKHSVRFKLRKKIAARRNAIEERREETVERIRSL